MPASNLISLLTSVKLYHMLTPTRTPCQRCGVHPHTQSVPGQEPLRQETSSSFSQERTVQREESWGAAGPSTEPRMKGRRGGPPRKAWDEGRVWPPDYVRVSEAWWGEGLIPSFLASVLGLLGTGDGQGPHLPKTTFQLQPGKEAPGPRRGEGSRALSRALNAPPINQGLG